MAAPFAEVRLDLGYDYGAAGGPEYRTQVAVSGGGRELRNAAWAAGRGRWQVGERMVDKATLATLLAFFRARRGRYEGFRWKDWSDFEAQDEALSPTGAPTVQLVKTYTSGATSHVRTISKPVAGTVTLKRNGTAFSGWTLDTTTGVVTLPVDISNAIVDITNANPGVVTAWAHGFSTGDVIWISGVNGMTEVNDRAYTITVLSPDTFNIGVDTTSWGPYTFGGMAAKYVQPSESLSWSGEFDVPVRFDTDHFQAQFEIADESGERFYYVSALPIVEIRP